MHNLTTKLLKLLAIIILGISTWMPSSFASIESYKPRSIFGAGGATSISIMSSAYTPISSVKPSMTLGLDLDLSEQWNFNIRTFSTQDDSLGGTRLGFSVAIMQEKTVLRPTNPQSAPFVVSTMSNWSFEVGGGLARLVLNQALESSLPFVPANLKSVPVKIPLYGIFLSAISEYHFTSAWGMFGEYMFTYATGSTIHLVGHTFQTGARLWL